MARAASPAEHYRAHAEVFRLALELKVSPKEAEAVLAQRAARARWEDSMRRLDAVMARQIRGASGIGAAIATAIEQSQPWMMRD